MQLQCHLFRADGAITQIQGGAVHGVSPVKVARQRTRRLGSSPWSGCRNCTLMTPGLPALFEGWCFHDSNSAPRAVTSCGCSSAGHSNTSSLMVACRRLDLVVKIGRYIVWLQFVGALQLCYQSSCGGVHERHFANDDLQRGNAGGLDLPDTLAEVSASCGPVTSTVAPPQSGRGRRGASIRARCAGKRAGAGQTSNRPLSRCRADQSKKKG